MSACFHPTQDLVLSASLDQTARVWDISSLHKKSQSERKLPTDFLNMAAPTVKHVLEGHDRGVNWASFHQSFPLIVTGADDRHVKLWRMNDTKAWEVDTMRGHVNNVSCVMFHPRQELIVSNSEDKTIRIWDIAKRSCVWTHRRDGDRFWILAVHPHLNVLAAGHDSGLMVFKLQRERPASCVQGNTLLYVKDKYVRLYEYGTQQDTPIMTLRRPTSIPPRSLHYNSVSHSLLVFYDENGGAYELYQLPKQADSAAVIEPKRGQGQGAVFVRHNRFAVLSRRHEIIVRNLEGEDTKKVTPPGVSASMIFPASAGRVLLRSDDKVALFDIEQRKILGEVAAPQVKYVYWSGNESLVALVSKHTITICDGLTLAQKCMVHETIRLKSGAWDESGTFVYSTLNHIKYCLPNGDNGTIRTLDVPLYITKVSGDIVHCLDRDGATKTLFVDSTEYMFKVSLLNKNFAEVKRIIQSSRMTGHAIIGYLQQKGYPEVALHFVTDQRTRFNLALQCGKISVALECAGAANDKECWARLAREALKQGKLNVVEEAYQRMEAFERLSFLYLITGQLDKLRQMLDIAQSRGDVMGMFHNALYLGDIGERVRVLEHAGLHSLAYVTSATHGLVAQAEALTPKVPLDTLVIPASDSPSLLLPPIPLNRITEWPLLNVPPDVFAGINEGSSFTQAAAAIEPSADAITPWGDDLLDLGEPGSVTATPSAGGAAAGAGIGADVVTNWGDDDGLDLPEDVIVSTASDYVPPQSLPGVEQLWVDKSHYACDHAAAGDFESAMHLLHLQIGAVSFKRFRPFFLTLWQAAHTSVHHHHHTPSLLAPLLTATAPPNQRLFTPPCLTLPTLVEHLKVAYSHFNQNKLEDAVTEFEWILSAVPLLKPASSEMSDVNKLKSECREYLLGIKLETQRRNVLQTSPVTAAELAAYFTHCSLQPTHAILALKTAMGIAYKISNFTDAGNFAKRLLERAPPQELAQQARKVHMVAEQKKSNQHRLDYDQRNPFVVCAESLRPIYKGSPFVQCAYCGAHHGPSSDGKLCSICQISRVGVKGSGLFAEAQF
eukprot:c20563_g1_i3.p1 GENE.c20563_g1_i3~~c20563_g1_i3.p1  ORF type:complete len:1208 (+),score=306.98 c20563_g1_i3:444-3626(+)